MKITKLWNLGSKLLFMFAFFGFLQARAEVNIGVSQAPSSSTITNWQPVTVSATLTPDNGEVITGCDLVFRTLAAGTTNWWNTNAMTNVSGNLWQGVVPHLPIGGVEYRVVAHYTGGDGGTKASSDSSYTVLSDMIPRRYTDFALTGSNKWVQIGSTSNYYFNVPGTDGSESNRWYANESNVSSGNVTGQRPQFDGGNAPLPFGYLRSITGSYIRSPRLPEGVGTVYYSSSTRFGSSTATVEVQVTTSNTPDTGWETVATVIYDGAMTEAAPVVINRRDARYVRLIRTDDSVWSPNTINNAVLYAYITVSPPPADVSLAPAVQPVTPPEPVIEQETIVRCTLVEASAYTPTINRRLNLYYQHNGGSWLSVPMAHESGNTYAVVFPNTEAGTNNYYFAYDFDGYFYRFDPDGTTATEPEHNEKVGRRVTPTNHFTVVTENTRIINIVPGAIDFGLVPIDGIGEIALVVRNTGNSALTVTSVDSTEAVFSVAPDNFVIQPFSSNIVTVTFDPSGLDAYSGTLTFNSNKTSGDNEVAVYGTGSVIEAVTTPDSIYPNTIGGTRLAWLSFTASGSTNNYPARGVEYRFDWGNNTTSAWGNAAQSNFWNTVGTYNVKAQARSEASHAKISDWSDVLSTVTITNTRIISVTNSVDFGNVVTNTSKQVSIIVSNSAASSDDLTVMNISCSMGDVVVSANSFVLSRGASTNVTLTFTPTLLQAYSGNLTIFCNKTSGNSVVALSGTGIVKKEVSEPMAITGPTAGKRTELLSFTASGAVNTHTPYGDGIEYRFDWGNSVISPWSSNAQNYAWTNIGVYNIKAQARSSQVPSVVSPWSADLLSVTITNVRAITVSGNLNFGTVVTNLTVQRTVAIGNTAASSDTLVVSNIVCTMNDVVVSPTSFSLPPGATTNVTVTFTPTVLGSYSGNFSIEANQTSGGPLSLAMSATAIEKETVTVLSFTGPSGGATNEMIVFTAQATNNWSIFGVGVQYRFDWGDSRISPWSSSNAVANSWDTMGNYSLAVQARSASNHVVETPWFPLGNVLVIRSAPIVTFNTNVVNGGSIPVTVSLAGLNACSLYYSPSGSSHFQGLPLTAAGGNDWTGLIPPINAGPMRYYVKYTLPGPIVVNWPNNAPYPVHVVTNALGSRRHTEFVGWSVVGVTSNYYFNVPGGDGTEPNRWFAYEALVSASAPAGQRPQFNGANAPLPYGYLRSIKGSYIRTPRLAEGVGTVYFTTSTRYNSSYAVVNVQVTTSDTPDSGWETVKTLTYTGAQLNAIPIKINRHDARYVRLIRTDDTVTSPNTLDNAVLFGYISVSIPATDVQITERLRNPGYPSRKQDVLMRCMVEDLDPAFPSINRRVNCYYSWQNPSGPFTAVEMVPQGGDLYHVIIPKHEIGRMYYYFKCDFDGYSYSKDPDGTTSPQPTNDERVVSETLPDGAPAATQPPYTIRRYNSIFSGVEIQTDPIDVAVATNDVTLVDDNTWQGLTLVKGVSNLTWRFIAHNAYTNNAEEFDPNPWVYGDNDQDSRNPPIAGNAELNGADFQADLDYNGFLLFRINTDPARLDYIVKRAVYQNFDTPFWQASPNIFEESLGLYAMKSFPENFDTWSVDSYPLGDYRSSDLELIAGVVGQDYVAPPGYFAGAESWAFQSGKAVADRGYRASVVAANTALALSSEQRGLVWNTSGGLTPGVDQFTFDARVRVEDNYFALFTGDGGNNPFTGNKWKDNYVVSTTVRAQEMSVAQAYISILSYFQPSFFGNGPGSFYEVRLMQITDPDAGNFSDNRIGVRLFRWDEGSKTPTQIATSSGIDIVDNRRLTDGAITVEITVDKTINPGKTTVDVRLDMTGGSTNLIVAPVRFIDSNGLTAGGSVGFMTFDTVPVISRLAVREPNNTPILAAVTNWSSDARWFMGGKRLDNQNRWQVNAAGALYRPLPTTIFGVYTAPAMNNLDQPNFSDLVPRAQLTGLNLAMKPYTVTLKEWDRMFVVIQNCATNIGKPLNDLPIVVDNFALSPWRAKTRTINPMGSSVYRFWENWDDQFAWLDTEKGWAVLEGWIGTSPASSLNELQLERSRANPALVQAIVSPVLTNGIGSITFNHRATNGKVVFAIERTSSNGDQSDYNVTHPLAVVTNSANVFTPFFLPIRELFTGRVRVRLLPESDPYAILKIDDLLVRDYPPRDETTWQAYNMLITSTQTNRVFDGQSGFLNKAPDIGTAGSANLNSPGTEILSESRPFIQSPQVDTGVGEISFWYRVWDTNSTGRIEIKVAASLDAPENQWRTVADFTVTNIEYQVFKIEPYDITNKVLRIYSHTNGYNRVALDNIMMTEPVRAGYEIKFVRLLLDQPLENQMAGVEVEIGRFVMNPSNIQVFVSYHTTPTEVWGYTNWWTMNDTAGSRLLELEEVAPRVYRTAGNNGIPAFPVDTPVQYVAWGTHADLPPEADKIFQPTNTFANPEWYYPRDMNGPATAPVNGLGAQGWSPYYFVYSCKPGAVWLNEFNYYRIPADNGFEFVELAGPANTLIGGWRIESININNANDVLDFCEVDSGFRLGNNGNGWGFFVWGDSGVDNVDQTFKTVATANLPQNGGIRLVRSMGAWEQRLAYGPSRANLMPAGYEDSGMAKPLSGTPQVVALIGSGNVYSDFMWVLLTGAATRTPGAENTSQVLEPIQAESFMIISVVGDHGGHNIGQSQIASIEVESGHSTQIVYTADQWFRIASFKSNGQNVPQAVGVSNYVWIVGSVSQDYSNDVTFAAATATEVGIAPVDPAWARGFYASEAAALADASLATDYLLNLDPTVEYDIGLTFNTIERDNDQVSVAVVLKDGGTNLTTTINGVLKLQGKENLTDGAWQDIGSAAINNASFVNGTNLVIFTEVTNNFFQAVIEPLN